MGHRKVKNAALQFKVKNKRDAVIACMGLCWLRY
jgi:hypothetical protein